jgi:hypothetical protein
MGTNNKTSPTNERTYFNNSPNNKKNSSGTHQQQFQRPTPSKSINIRTPPNNNRNHSSGLSSSSLSNPISGSTNITNNNKRLSGSCSPPNFSYFAGSKCFESPSPQSLPKPPTSWFNEVGSKKRSSAAGPARVNRVRKTLSMTSAEFFTKSTPTSCAAELVKHQNQSSYSSNISNDLCTQNLKLMLNVNA